MPTVPVPGPRQEYRRGPELLLSCLERPRPEEVHALLLGLDGLAAALAVRLLRCGVLALNVNDPAPVTAADLGTGAYRPADVGRPREAALRRRLRELDARCAPVSAPQLFPGALLPGTVVVRSLGPPPAADLALPGTAEPWGGIDPRHPLVSLHRAGGVLLRWPTVPWAHRPCPDCVRATLGAGGTGPGPHGAEAVLTAWAATAHAEAVAVRLAVEVLAVALVSLDEGSGPAADRDGARHAVLFAPPWPDPVASLEPDRSRCLCGIDQE